MKLLTERETADLLRVAPATLRVWRHYGKGPSYFRLEKAIRYSQEDVQNWLKRCMVLPQSEKEVNKYAS